MLKLGIPEIGMDTSVELFLKALNQRYNLLKIEDKSLKIKNLLKNLKTYVPSTEEVDQLYKEYTKYFSRRLHLDDFVRILYRTRRIQHAIDPIKHPLDLERIQAIAETRSLMHPQTPEEKLLNCIFGYNNYSNIINELDVLETIPEGENIIECDAKRMQLIHTLNKGLY